MALPQAQVNIPFVDAEDITEVVVKALLDEMHNGKIYQLTGPEGITFKEAIQRIAEASNRDITFIPITVKEYRDAMQKADVPGDFIWLIEYLFTEVLGNPNNSEITQDIEKVLNRKPISFDQYAEQTAQTGVWDTKTKELAG